MTLGLIKLAAAGDFEADLMAQNTQRGSAKLATAKTPGDVRDAIWQIDGSVNRLSVGGHIDGWHLRTGGDVNSLNLGVVHQAAVGDVDDPGQGRIRKLSAKQWTAGHIAAPSIGSVSIVGDRKDGRLKGNIGAELVLQDASAKYALRRLCVSGWLDAPRVRSIASIGMVSVGGVRSTLSCVGTAPAET